MKVEFDMRYPVRLKESEEGYAVWCPSLPGCWSQGETKEEALENIKDAIQIYFETLEEVDRDAESLYVEVS
ncbi:type II toxin-antitoxin system HicB family antitoxin [Synechococcus sp. PCC 7336]|uniref:type II toxin-antitoxin system HicB family antitoxin n=1 Tax=Synechococcus sp. PCC 7336 TaxID=195250 RepID=UPI0003677763|nr:type II toxin-antitoxin system HicB family antitoxin [Synechococcus sp. PCC 7336]